MIIGIDLGTTNSLAAVWRDGRPQLVPNSLGHTLTPSVVGLDDRGEVLVGLAARERLLTHEHLSAAVFKRYMGSKRTMNLGKRQFRPEELSSLVLRALKADAEAWLGESVTGAVITVPAYFNDAQRKATRIAGELAGLKVERLLNEPTAAALSYGLHKAGVETKFLIFDLGGGTFDVSVLELFEGVMEVRASGGDAFLGGEDFVKVLMDAFMTEVGNGAGITTNKLPPDFYQALRDTAERAKRQLTKEDKADLRVIWKGETLSWEITASTFTELCEPLLSRLRAPIERALRDARLRAEELDEVILAGGATRMPLIRKLVARMFGRLPATHLNPDEVVALGAAVQTELLASGAVLGELVLTDVCPYTMGIEVVEEVAAGVPLRRGVYLPIIERNVVVPTSRVKELQTVSDRQTKVALNIFQGESRNTKDNVQLGTITIPVPRRPAGEVALEVRFTYDLSGLLEVDVHVPLTGARHDLVIEENPGVLSPVEILERRKQLAALKVHPREDAVNLAALARAERLYEQSLGATRAFVEEHIKAFLKALESQESRAATEARERLISGLDSIESDSYL